MTTAFDAPRPSRRPRAIRRRSRHAARGFSLIEVLVSMLVVAMGILALAGLLQASIRYAKMSEMRSTAALLANDIADRMRANAVGAQLGAGGYDLTGGVIPTALVPARAPCSSDAPCGPDDLARSDLGDWTARVRATLPKGSAWIQFHAGRPPAPDFVDVWVGWTDPLTLAPGIATDRSGTECPAGWTTSEPAVRCVYLQVAL